MPHSKSEPQLFIGLISGTSADDIDAALVCFDSEGDTTRCELVHGRTYPWPDELRARLIALGQGAPIDSLKAGVTALGMEDPDQDNLEHDALLEKAIRLAAAMPTMRR